MDSSASTINQIYPLDEEKNGQAPAHDGVIQGFDKKTEAVERNLSANNASSVPNGGTMAWLQVLSAHILFFNSW